MEYSWSKRVGRLRIWIAGQGDERHLYPTAGVLNRQPFAVPGIMAEDGELTVYLAWWIVEISLRLKKRPALCVRGEAGKREWWDVTE